jgi:RimJ/RimL family protein N-acetyltransferase
MNLTHHDKIVVLVPISALDEIRHAALDARVVPCYEEEGPTNQSCWKSPAAQKHLYAIERQDREIVGVVYLNLPGPASPGWWIDPAYRECKFGAAAVDAIAKMMIERRVALGQVIINPGPHSDASRALLCHLKVQLRKAGLVTG